MIEVKIDKRASTARIVQELTDGGLDVDRPFDSFESMADHSLVTYHGHALPVKFKPTAQVVWPTRVTVGVEF